jgi:hypothetical protein
MKQINLLVAVLVLTCFAFVPAAVRADDELEDLEITMEVFDDDDDFANMIEMRGPGSGEVGSFDDDGEGDELEHSEDEPYREDGDDFDGEETGLDIGDEVDEEDLEQDDDFESDHDFDDEDDIDEENDHEEGEDIEDDVDDDEEDDMEDDDEPDFDESEAEEAFEDDPEDGSGDEIEDELSDEEDSDEPVAG